MWVRLTARACRRSALAGGREPRVASMLCTRAARLRPVFSASPSRTAQNSSSGATEVRWPEREKERFFSKRLLRGNHVFGANHGVEFLCRDIAALDRFFL